MAQRASPDPAKQSITLKHIPRRVAEQAPLLHVKERGPEEAGGS